MCDGALRFQGGCFVSEFVSTIVLNVACVRARARAACPPRARAAPTASRARAPQASCASHARAQRRRVGGRGGGRRRHARGRQLSRGGAPGRSGPGEGARGERAALDGLSACSETVLGLGRARGAPRAGGGRAGRADSPTDDVRALWRGVGRSPTPISRRGRRLDRWAAGRAADGRSWAAGRVRRRSERLAGPRSRPRRVGSRG